MCRLKAKKGREIRSFPANRKGGRGDSRHLSALFMLITKGSVFRKLYTVRPR